MSVIKPRKEDKANYIETVGGDIYCRDIYEARLNEYIKVIEDINRECQSKILSWYAKNGKDEEFAKFFGIQTIREGKV